MVCVEILSANCIEPYKLSYDVTQLGGNDVGAWLAPAAVDAASQTRSYATSVITTIISATLDTNLDLT